MVEDRKLAVLRAIVEDYVSTQEPVGSKALVDRHRLGVSPATVRNDMAVLEDEGYITQPHTSAGRVPTDKGYRLFVDKLTTVKPMSGAEKRAIATFLDQSIAESKVRAANGVLAPKWVYPYVIADSRNLIRGAPFDSGKDNDLWADFKTKVGKLTAAQVREIATAKLPDLNANDLDAAEKIIAGTARSMGITVEG